MTGAKSFPLLFAMLGLGACAVGPPAGPTILVVPPEGKNLAQFQQEDTTCRSYALNQTGYGATQQAATQGAVGSAAVGTAVGAGAGAALGAAAGSAGTGAAIGAGTGLLAGSAVGASNASASAAELQRRYDVSYAQCMTASGNHVQSFPMAWPYGPYGYPYAYPAYYGPWFGPPVSLGFFGGFGPRFHHRGFAHRGFHGAHRF